MFFLSPLQVIDNLDLPVIMVIANSRIAIAGDFIVELGNWSRNVVRVQIARSRTMLKSDNIAILKELDRAIQIKRRFVPTRMYDPFVIVVLVMVASYLLLLRTDRV